MKKHNYIEIVDGICFKGSYVIEEDEGFDPIFTLETITIDNHVDLMLVIDPRVIQEIEGQLLEQWKWD